VVENLGETCDINRTHEMSSFGRLRMA